MVVGKLFQKGAQGWVSKDKFFKGMYEATNNGIARGYMQNIIPQNLIWERCGYFQEHNLVTFKT